VASIQRASIPREWARIVGRYGFLEPDDVQLGKIARELERLFSGIRTVGIDKQRDVGANCLPCCCHPFQIIFGVRANFHFDMREARLRPSPKLILQLRDRIGCKASAPIGDNVIV